MIEENEEWRDIPGYENLYQISSIGRVKSLKFGKERILNPGKNSYGYIQVFLFDNKGKMKNMRVHRLVASAFLSNPYNLPQINHKNEDKTDNRVENLEYCDSKYNNNYGSHNKRVAKSKSKAVICIETGKIYPSTKEVSRRLGFSQGNIWSCCKGKRNTCGGYHWQYA